MAFGQGLPQGSMDAVTEALARRGMGGSVPQLSQVTGASPTMQGTVAPSMGAVSGGVGMPAQQQSAPQVPQVPQTQDEAKIIVNGLIGRLKVLSQAQQGGIGL